MAQYDIDELVRSIQDLVQDLRGIKGTAGGSATSATRDLVDAIALLVKRLDRSTKSAADSISDFRKELDDATKSIEDSQKALSKAEEERKKASKTQKELQEEEVARRRGALRAEVTRQRMGATESQKLWQEMSSLGGGTEILKNSFMNLGQGSLEATTGLQGIAAGATGLLNATKAMAGGLYKGERGATLSAKAFSELIGPLTTFGNILGGILMLIPHTRLLGLLITALSKILKTYTEFNLLAAEQLDKLTKQFYELGRAGVSLQQGITDVFELGQVAGVAVSQLETFNKLLAENVQNLGMLGGTAAEGAKKFAQIAGVVVKELGRDLELLGVTQEEQREIALSYLQIQERTGRVQTTNINALAKASANYILELDELAEITGTSRKAMQEAREAALAEERFRAARYLAQQTGDVEYQRILDIAEKAAAAARSVGDVRGATGILQVGAARGAMTTPEAVAAEQTFRISQLFASNPTQAEIAAHMARSVKLQQDSLAGTNVMVGSIEALQTNSVKNLDFLARQEKLQQAAQAAGFGADTQAYIEAVREKRIASTPEMQQIVEGTRAQQNAALMMDAAVRTFSDASNISLQASKIFAQAVGMAPGTTVTGGMLKTSGAAASGSRGAMTGTMTGNLGAGMEGGTGGGFFGAVGRAIGAITRGGIGGVADPGSLFAFGGGTGSRENFDRLDPAFRDRLTKMAQEYNAMTGRTIGFSSGARSQEENARVGGAATSLHLQGRAVDLNSSDVAQLKGLGLLDSYGFKQGKDPWHISDTGFATGGIAYGPRSGYTARLHGTEAVIPLPDGKSIPVEMSNLSNSIGEQMGVMSAQLGKLEEMISIMRDTNSISGKILQATNNLT